MELSQCDRANVHSRAASNAVKRWSCEGRESVLELQEFEVIDITVGKSVSSGACMLASKPLL